MTIGSSTTIFMNGYRNWQSHNSRVAKALERISSGNRINRAADDVAGLGIAERMKAQLAMLNRQQNISQDYISAAEMADGKLAGMQDIVLRMTELATMSASGTLTDDDRKLLDKEYQALLDELDGTGRTELPKLPPLTPAKEAGAPDGDAFTITGGNIKAYLDGLNSYLDEIDAAALANDNEKLNLLLGENTAGLSNAQWLAQGVTQFTKENGAALLNSGTNGTRESVAITMKDGRLTIAAASIDRSTLGLKGTNIKTQEGAEKAMEALKNAGKEMAARRSDVGTLYNEYQRTTSRLARMEENLTDSLSRITDADIAKEMMIYVKEQVLAQASMFVMAQGRVQAEDILKMLKT